MDYDVWTGKQVLEEYYPYTATDGICDAAKINSAPAGRYISLGSGSIRVPPMDTEALKRVVQEVYRNPVVVYLNADDPAFGLFYKGQYVYEGSTKCHPMAVNHAVVVVGYSTSGCYWIIKNS